ncbi:MAG TPA: arginine--tRNA ligase [Patescibacteria group bacterium]|nr:arginine--tRNA ligase [Patescibacteria group bacterium]
MKEALEKRLEEIVKKLTDKEVNTLLSIPKDISKGDFTSNVAFQIGKSSGKNPMDVAREITAEFASMSSELSLEKVEAAAPGFINFYLSTQSLSENLQQVLKSPEKVAGIRNLAKYPKAIVEYSSPNIAKPFTVGHFRSTIIGDAIANLLEAVGYKVYRDNHLGDWGTQFGKQIYAIKTWGNEQEIEKSENPVKNLVALYVKFHEEAEKDPELEERAREWFKKLEDGDPEARRLWQKCIDWSFKEFDRIYKELGVSFTENGGRGYGEAFFEGKMEPIIKELEEKGLVKTDKGAKLVFFPNDKYPPLMVIKQDGATLYATRDLATDKFRLEHYGKDILVINEVGMEQSLYFKQLFETEYMLGWYTPGQRVHVGHGLFRFKEGKMSTRKGNVIWLDEVLDEAEKRAQNLSKGSLGIAKEVAMGALKWNDLKRSAHMDVTFDWDEILTMNGNSGPYVQYAYTRTQSVLKKADNNVILGSAATPESNSKKDSGQARMTDVLSPDYTPSSEELNLLRKLVQFAPTVEEAVEKYAPNVVCEYLFELAQMFNNFYQKHRILNAEKDVEKRFRLGLTEGVGIVLKQGLNLLGIQAPEKM